MVDESRNYLAEVMKSDSVSTSKVMELAKKIISAHKA